MGVCVALPHDIDDRLISHIIDGSGKREREGVPYVGEGERKGERVGKQKGTGKGTRWLGGTKAVRDYHTY